MKLSLVRAAFVFGGLGAAAMAQTSWALVTRTGPSARYEHAMAYESQHARVVLFGGRETGPNNTILRDTWTWNGTTWMQVATTGPRARTSHAMAYDSQRGRIVLFGGWPGSGYLADTWEWDGGGWTQVATTGPTGRAVHAMVYDTQRARTVLFGGFNATARELGDTWEWDGSSWTQVAVMGPLARSAHSMAYDTQRGRTVLFGGFNGATALGDTWEWSGTTYTLASLAGPGARDAQAMTYDAQRGRIVLQGGYGNNSYFGDTWEWDGSAWTQMATTGPTARTQHAMAYDDQLGKSVMFGGYNNPAALGDTWEWLVSSTAAAFGIGCGAPFLDMSSLANALPTINTTAQARLTNIPSSLAFVALGWSRTALGPFVLPIPLAGMPGCEVLQSSEAAALPVTPNGHGAATFNLTIPNWPVLIGVHVYLQGWAYAPGANSGNTIVSNGLDWGIGS